MSRTTVALTAALLATGITLLTVPGTAGAETGTSLTAKAPTPSTTVTVTTTAPKATATTPATTEGTISGAELDAARSYLLDTPAGAQGTMTPDAGAAGTAVHLAGTGCTIAGRPGRGRAVFMHRRTGAAQEQFTTQADATGNWKITKNLPSGTPAGEYDVFVGCDSTENRAHFEYFERTFTVTAATAVKAATAVRANPTFTG